MNEIANRLVNHLLLWHCTFSKNAEAISREGFRPRRPKWLGRKVTWFSQSAIPFLEMVTAVDQAKFDGLFCAVNLDRYTLGRDYAHQATNVFIFNVPLPEDVIVARFSVADINSLKELKRVLSEQLQCDVGTAFAKICLDETISWNQLTGIAATLRELDSEIYHNTELTKRLICEEVGVVDDSECSRLFSLLVEGNQAFHRRFLQLYYSEYPSPHFTRALMVAGARFVHPVQSLALHDPTIVIPDYSPHRHRDDDESVAALLAEILPKISRKEAVFGAIEMAAMRKFPGDETDLRIIENWIAQHGQLAEEAAFYFIRFGGDTFPSRQWQTAVRMAVAALRGTGVDYFERLSHLTETEYPDTPLLIRAFGLLKEERAIPYLSSCLKDRRKQIRRHAVEALGQISTPEAIELVKEVANDKAKVVQRAVQAALGHRQ